MMNHRSATKLATVMVEIQPPQNSEGRSATVFLVLERNARCGIEPGAARAHRNPDDDDDHERRDQHVTDEDEPGHGCVRPPLLRPMDCRYAITASSSDFPSSPAGAPEISASV